MSGSSFGSAHRLGCFEKSCRTADSSAPARAGAVTTPPRIEPFPALTDTWLAALPLIGPVLAQQTVLTLLALALVPALAWLLYRTPLGLALRAVGLVGGDAEALAASVEALRPSTARVEYARSLVEFGAALRLLADVLG